MRVSVLFFLLFSALCLQGQNITTIAGCGSCSSLGDNGPATAASIGYFAGLAVDKSGNVFIADGNHHRIRKVDRETGLITTIAGTGTMGYNGDGIAATSAYLNWPVWVVVNYNGDLYIEDGGNYRIRRVDAVTGLISTTVGNGIAGYSGDNGQASAAKINSVTGIALDKNGNLYFNDGGNYRVRKVNLSTGIINTVAGNGNATCTGDGGLATNATISGMLGICTDNGGNIITTDSAASVRKIVSSTGVINRIAGTGDNVGTPYTGDGNPAVSTRIEPFGVVVDDTGNLYIADYSNSRIEKVDTFGVIRTIAGTGVSGFSGDEGIATAANISLPENVVLDKCNNVYIADYNNRRVRKITYRSCDYTSVKQLESNKSNVSIYPSPANNYLTITTKEKISTITIANMLGQLMMTQSYDGPSMEKVELDIGYLPPGMYIVRVNEVWVQRFMK